VAALFAIHPLHVESVAWVSERKDVLSGLFFALTLAAYLGYVRRPFSVLRYLLVVFCFALGLLSKPMLVTLPFALWLLDYWPLGRWKPFAGAVAATEGGFVPAFPRRVILEKVPLILLAAASCAVTMMAQTTAMAALEGIPWTTRAANAMVSYIVYLGQSLWPASLVAFYPYTRDALSWWTVAGSVILLASVSVVVVMWRRNRPYLLLGWLWYLGMLVPVIGLVQVGAQARADRYMYLPLIGPSLALAWASIELTGESLIRRRLCGMAWLLVLVALTAMASQQASYWRDSETLWTHALTATSRNWQAHNSLGTALAARGQLDEAIAHFQKALEIQPDDAETHYNLGKALAGRGQVEGTIAHYRKALEIRPDFAEAHNNLGNVLVAHGQFNEATTHYQKALEINPDYVEANYNLGIALAGRGQIEGAIAHYQKALEINPDDADTHNALALALASRGQVDEAIAHFHMALKIQADSPNAHNNLALALVRRGQVDEAITHYLKALEYNPNYAMAHFNLGNALIGREQIDEAIAHYQKALDIQPDLADVHNNLAVALAGRGRLDEAIPHYQKALDIKPEDVNARRNLAMALSQRERILKSLAERQDAMRIRPNDAALLNDTAWMLATNPNASVRNGPDAVELAQRALRLSGGNEPAILGTLSAAYAEAGRFSDAVQTGEEAVRLAAAAGQRSLAEQFRIRLQLYRNGKPHRQPPDR